MEQILLHLWGDYILQTDWMARNKAKCSKAAAVHATVYSLPFLLLKPSLAAFAVILLTHFLIDRFALARYLVFAKNWVTDRSLRWKGECDATGYPKEAPSWLTVWLLIAADNTLHLTTNYAALRWL